MPILHKAKPRTASGKPDVRYVDPIKERSVPEGCISVWQIQSRNGRNYYEYHGVFRSFEVSLACARVLNEDPAFRHHTFTLCHKAAALLADGCFHLVHFNPIKFKNPDDVLPAEPLSPEPYDDDSPPW